MITVILYGHLAEKFGRRRYRFAVKSAAEAIRALSSQIPGFRKYLSENSAPGYHVVVGKEDKDETQLHEPLGREKTLKIIPAVAGASGGWGKVIVGAVLVAVGYAITAASGGSLAWLGGAVSNIGLGMMITGAAELLFAPPKPRPPGSTESANNQPSFAFDGAVNTAAQGNPVPLCYGELIVGSQVVSAGLSVEQI